MKKIVIIGILSIAFIVGINMLVFYKQDQFVEASVPVTTDEASGIQELHMMDPKPEVEDDHQYDTVQQKMTLLLQPDVVYGYEGNNLEEGRKTDYSDVRDMVREATKKGFIILIKPEKDATYKNTIDILDEMSINNVPRYRVMDITEEEQKFLDQFNQGAP